MIVLFAVLGMTLFFLPGGFVGGYSFLKEVMESFKFEQRLDLVFCPSTSWMTNCSG
jgi:hypothetical protein